MLRQRVLTAIVLLAILLPALFHARPEPFALVTLVLVSAGAWEWARLNGMGSAGSVATGLVCLTACVLAWWGGWIDRPLTALWQLSGAAWVLLGAALLARGVPAWPRVPFALRWLGGVFALWVTWMAVVQARGIGINFLLSILCLVWMADIAAYFAGRAFGGRIVRVKLASSISPGKSWEGAWGGMAGVLLLGLVWMALDQRLGASVPSLYSRLWATSAILLPLGALFLAAMSVVGDLVESLIKRAAGAKDSSGLLPGHGGVLDRVDALLPVLPLAMMLSSG